MATEADAGSAGYFENPEYARSLIDVLAERRSRVEVFLSHIPGGKFVFDVLHPRILDMQDDLYVDFDDHAHTQSDQGGF